MRPTLIAFVFVGFLLSAAFSLNQDERQYSGQKENIFAEILAFFKDGLTLIRNSVQTYTESYSECVRTHRNPRLSSRYDSVVDLIVVLYKCVSLAKGPHVAGFLPPRPSVHNGAKFTLPSALLVPSTTVMSEPILVALIRSSASVCPPGQCDLVPNPRLLSSLSQRDLSEPMEQDTTTPALSLLGYILREIFLLVVQKPANCPTCEFGTPNQVRFFWVVGSIFGLFFLQIFVSIKAEMKKAERRKFVQYCKKREHFVAQFKKGQQEYREAKRAREAEAARRQQEHFEARRSREEAAARRQQENCEMYEQWRMESEDVRSRQVAQQELCEACERSCMELEDRNSRKLEAERRQQESIQARERALMEIEDKRSCEQLQEIANTEAQQLREVRERALLKWQNKQACEAEKNELRQQQLRAAVRVQTLWRKQLATALLAHKKAQLAEHNAARNATICADHAQLCAVALLLQTLWRRRQAEENMARARIQCMTRDQRTIARKVHKREDKLSIKLKEIPVPDDGNCLFYALSLHICGATDQYSTIRNEICNWLAMNADYEVAIGLPLVLSEDQEWPEFLRALRKDKEYGSLPCLYAAAELFAATIHVINAQSDDLYIVPKTCVAQRVLWLSFSGSHYNPLLYDHSGQKSFSIPENTPSGMWTCYFCTRWHDVERATCPRCGTMKLQQI